MARSGDAALSKNFVEKLRLFYRSLGQPFKTPVFNKKEMDLLQLWQAVQEKGGSAKVCQEKGWASVGRIFNPPKSMTNLSFHVKRIYARCLLPYERWVHPELAMSDEVERLGPFSNKKCKDGHIFYGPPLVTRNKRQRGEEHEVQISGDEYLVDAVTMPPRKYFMEGESGQRCAPTTCCRPLSPARKNDMPSAGSYPSAEIETQQAAAMLWGLKSSEMQSIHTLVKVESTAALAEYSPDPSYDDGAQQEQVPASNDDSGAVEVSRYKLEDWYQHKMSEMQKQHEEEVEILKQDLERVRRVTESYQVALLEKEAAYQECRWCYKKLLQVINCRKKAIASKYWLPEKGWRSENSAPLRVVEILRA